MDIDLDEEQKMMLTTARKFLEKECPKSLVRETYEDERGYSVNLWRQVVELGWTALPFPEIYGGLGRSFLDLALILEETGRSLAPIPLLPTVALGGFPILEFGSAAQKEAIIPKLIQGELILTSALAGIDGDYSQTAMAISASRKGAKDFILNGTAPFVPYAQIAHIILCPTITTNDCAEDNATVFLVNSEVNDIDIKLLKTMAGEKQCLVSFDNAVVSDSDVIGTVNNGQQILPRMLLLASVAKCAEMNGNMRRILEMSVDHASTRMQFGRHIGSFQAIQHMLVDAAVDVDASVLLARQAAWRISERMPCEREAAMAKIWCSEAQRRVAMVGIRVHGGVGFMQDHDMTLYFQQGTIGEVMFGDAEFHRSTLADWLESQSHVFI